MMATRTTVSLRCIRPGYRRPSRCATQPYDASTCRQQSACSVATVCAAFLLPNPLFDVNTRQVTRKTRRMPQQRSQRSRWARCVCCGGSVFDVMPTSRRDAGHMPTSNSLLGDRALCSFMLPDPWDDYSSRRPAPFLPSRRGRRRSHSLRRSRRCERPESRRHGYHTRWFMAKLLATRLLCGQGLRCLTDLRDCYTRLLAQSRPRRLHRRRRHSRLSRSLIRYVRP